MRYNGMCGQTRSQKFWIAEGGSKKFKLNKKRSTLASHVSAFAVLKIYFYCFLAAERTWPTAVRNWHRAHLYPNMWPTEQRFEILTGLASDSACTRTFISVIRPRNSNSAYLCTVWTGCIYETSRQGNYCEVHLRRYTRRCETYSSLGTRRSSSPSRCGYNLLMLK